MEPTEKQSEFKLSEEQFDEIVKRASEIAAELLAEKLKIIQKHYMAIFTATKSVYDKYPALKGKHNELDEVCVKLAQANPDIELNVLLERGACEVLRNAN